MNAVSVKNLVKRYGSLTAVDGISFEIEEGEIFGLIGPNGAGKTTTLRIISTIIRKTGGEVEVFGYRVGTDDSKIREIISYLPEEAGAYKNLTGFQYLKFMANFYARNGADEEEMFRRGVTISELGERLRDRVSTYSKGMARKLLLARSLMVKPKLAILDEPTVGLDVINSIEIRSLIKRFSTEGVTVLLSSHNMLEVEFLSDRVALINKGRIFETGKPEDLKKKYNARNLEEVFMEAVR